METIKNSCGGKGCRIRIILPNDRKHLPFTAKVLRVRNDIPQILPLFGVSLDQMEVKKAA